MRETSCPAITEPVTTPNDSGTSVKPAPVAETPMTLIMNRGRNAMVLRNAAPWNSSAMFDVLNTLFLNRLRSRIGLLLLSDRQTNATNMTKAMASIRSVVGDAHG